MLFVEYGALSAPTNRYVLIKNARDALKILSHLMTRQSIGAS
jgi:hypothetical protein